MNKAFSIKESVRFGWTTFKTHNRVLLLAVLTMFAVQIVSSILSSALEGQAVAGVVVGIALSLLSFVISTGFVFLTLKLARGESAEYRDLLLPIRTLWRYFLTQVLLGLIAFGIIAVGLALGALVSMFFSFALLPTIATGVTLGGIALVLYLYIAFRYLFIMFGVLEGAEVLESFHQSAKLTRGRIWALSLFVVVMALLNLAGVLCLFVGLLVSIPVTSLALAHVYLKVKAAGAGN